MRLHLCIIAVLPAPISARRLAAPYNRITVYYDAFKGKRSRARHFIAELALAWFTKMWRPNYLCAGLVSVLGLPQLTQNNDSSKGEPG